MSWMWESSSFLWNVIQKLDLAPLHPGWYYHLVVPWRLWIPWIDSDRNKARRSKKWSPQVISSCYFLLDGSPKLITHNLFATEFCHWNQWPLQAKALAEDFPNVVIAKSNQEVEKLQGGNRAVSFDLDLINDLDEYMKTCFEKHLSVPQISGSLHLHELWTLIVLMTRAVSIVVSHFWQGEHPQSCNGFDEFMSCPSKHAIELNLLRWWMRWNVSLWRYSSSRWMRWQQQLRPVGILQVGDRLGPFSLSAAGSVKQ